MDRERKGNSYLVVKSKNPPEVKKIMLSTVPQRLYSEQFKLTLKGEAHAEQLKIMSSIKGQSHLTGGVQKIISMRRGRGFIKMEFEIGEAFQKDIC